MRPILEDLPVGWHQSIHAFHYSAESFATPWHFHPQHELTLIEESTGTKFIGDYMGNYAPGELVLLRGNLPHCWKNHAETNRSRSTVVQWNPGSFARVPELESVFNLLREAARGLLFQHEDCTSLVPLLQSLPTLDAAARYGTLLTLLQGLTHCRWEPLSRAGFRERLPAGYDNRMQQVHRFVEQHFAQKIELSVVAEQVHLSEQAFHRFFKKMMGRPFFTFLNEYRIKRAGQLLIETDWPVSHVASACGFASLPFFHRQFKRWVGTTPLRYRKGHD